MAAHIGCSGSIVSRYLNRNGLQVPRELIIKFRAQKMTGRTTFTSEEDKRIRKEYLTTPIKKLAAEMGRAATGINGRLKAMGLTIPAEIINQRKLAGSFKMGLNPFNKGKKQHEFLSKEALERVRQTQFKKGQVPHNWAHYKDGEIVTHRDMGKKGGNKLYKWIRVTLRDWRMLHVYNWEKHNGPVPAGYIVVFKNGDTMNCEVNNLELITRAENMRRNSIHNYPEEIQKTIRTISKINKKIKQHEK